MPHGTPDWGLTGPKETTYGLDDLGEQAVRLGSPHLFNRQGDCLVLTDFRVGIENFVGVGAPIGWVIDLMTEHSRKGAYAIRLTSAGGAESRAGLLATLSYPVSSLLGLEFTFGSETVNRWIGMFDWYTGQRQYMAYMRVTDATGLLEYSTGAATWATQATLGGLVATGYATHTLKFVADMTGPAPEFVRAILNSNLELMTGILVPWVADVVTLPHLVIHIYVEGTADPEAVGWIDNVIVTQNEPSFQE